MILQDNMIKFFNYQEQVKRLSLALRNEFYVEAIAIEYAMIEDRIHSILTHSGFSIVDKNNKKYSINKNINKLKSNKYFTEKEMRKRLPLDLLDEIKEWKDKRNIIIHDLLKQEFQPDEFKELAIQGNELRKQIDNKSKLIKKYNEKLKAKGELKQ